MKSEKPSCSCAQGVCYVLMGAGRVLLYEALLGTQELCLPGLAFACCAKARRVGPVACFLCVPSSCNSDPGGLPWKDLEGGEDGKRNLSGLCGLLRGMLTLCFARPFSKAPLTSVLQVSSNERLMSRSCLTDTSKQQRTFEFSHALS